MLCLSGFELYSRWVPLKRAVPFPKTLVFSPTLLRSSQNFGRNVNGRFDSIGKLCFNLMHQ